MNSQKLARRKAMGDDPTAMAKSNSSEVGAIPAQPMPGMPQGPGNILNSPVVAQSMGNGLPQTGTIDPTNPQSAYGDPVFTPDVYQKLGTVGFAPPSGVQQNVVPGQMLNRNNMAQQPFEDTMKMMESMRLAQAASSTANKMYGVDQPASYMIGPLGMMGTPVEVAINAPMPGAFSSGMSGQTGNQLGLQGVPDAQAAANQMGMNTARGGGRNKQTKGA